jgi:hypothetical protein
MRIILVLVAAGVGLAILIGLLAGCNEDDGGAQARAESNLCSSLSSFASSVGDLENLDPISAEEGDYESAVSDVRDDWDQVESDAAELREANIDTLRSAWDNFEEAVDDVPDDASVSEALEDISEATQTLVSETQSTYRLNCS